MPDLLFLSHRLPFPPDKGEKIRAWHMFERLARTHRMHLGCFIDDARDWDLLPQLRPLCADLACFGFDRRWQKLKALLRLRPGRPLSQGYFHDPRLARWVRGKLAAGIDRVFVYCSAMAPYALEARGARRILDLVDVDSEKWAEYAARASGPARWIWARETRTLLALERRAALGFDQALFVSAAECARFAALAPETRGRIGWLDNGVDTDFFAPAMAGRRPFPPGGPDLVFTGTMDYWPNVDAVGWFAREVLPPLRGAHPDLRFWIVGANPTPEVRALAGLPGVQVTGRVADTRPYIGHADVAVAPLRIARGIQNKVLEAMAMARPVVASPQAFEGLRAEPGRHLLVAGDAAETVRAAAALLAGGHPGLGAAARLAVQRSHGWEATLAPLTALLEPPAAAMVEPVA